MLARHQPAEWVNATDVDASQYAVALERLLTEADRFAVPEQVALLKRPVLFAGPQQFHVLTFSSLMLAYC